MSRFPKYSCNKRQCITYLLPKDLWRPILPVDTIRGVDSFRLMKQALVKTSLKDHVIDKTLKVSFKDGYGYEISVKGSNKIQAKIEGL